MEYNIKLSWPSYQDTPIKAIDEIADAFAAFLKGQFSIESEFGLTAEGIIFTILKDDV
jgi:hypothetical protein